MASTSSSAPLSAPGISSERQALYHHLDQRKYRGNATASAMVALRTLAGVLVVWGSLAWLDGGGGMILRSAIALFWAMLVVRSFMLFHDAGHHSFIQGFHGASKCNWLAMHVFAVLAGTPTDWNYAHSLHHANVGNTGQTEYDWGETIFHTATQFRAMPVWKQRLLRFARHPIMFFTFAAAGTWFVKFRLPFDYRGGRKALYRLSDKMLSIAFFIARYILAYKINALGVVFVGDYLAMSGGVVLFHWQHVYNPGYVTKADTWNRFDASMIGSSIVTIPEFLKWVTVGIEYHHIHHFRTRVPGYALRACHEDAPQEYWAATSVLGYKEMWESLWFEVYDDVKGCYSTYTAVLQDATPAGQDKLKQG